MAFNSCGVKDFAGLVSTAAEEDGKSSGATARMAARITRSAFSLNFLVESARTTRNAIGDILSLSVCVCVSLDDDDDDDDDECRF